jgi:hypothetical protein
MCPLLLMHHNFTKFIACILIRANYLEQGIKSNLIELFGFGNYNIEYSMSILIIG